MLRQPFGMRPGRRHAEPKLESRVCLMEFLLIVLVLSVVGVVALLIRHRRPSSMRASIDEFERSREALAPGDRPRRRRGPGARRSG